MVSDDFRAWARSFSGCDGGNVKAGVWISGIEWGSASYDDGIYYRKLVEQIKAGAYNDYRRSYDWKESTTYPYGRSFAKLYTALNDVDIQNYREYVSTLSGSEVFKLNLYPIAFDSTDPNLWSDYELEQITGFREKHLFQTWCFYNRFPWFARQTEANSPKIVIGTGVSYLRDFLAFFGADPMSVSMIQFRDLKPDPATGSNRPRRFYWVNLTGGTWLFVIPFFSGSNGLNSDYLLGEMGRQIREISGYGSLI